MIPGECVEESFANQSCCKPSRHIVLLVVMKSVQGNVNFLEVKPSYCHNLNRLPHGGFCIWGLHIFFFGKNLGASY